MAKEVSSWRGIPDKSPDAQGGGRKSTGNGKFVGENKTILKKTIFYKCSSKYYRLFKTK